LKSGKIITILSVTNYIFRGRYAISFAARILGYRDDSKWDH
jgi:hypothetical protein